MSALPLTALRPLAFPSHQWVALICLRTGRVLAFVPAAPPVRFAADACGADAFAAGASRSDEPAQIEQGSLLRERASIYA